MSVTRINEFQAAAGKSDALFDFLTSLKQYIVACDGCEMCRVIRKKDDDQAFVVLEVWADEAAHQQSLANYPQDKMKEAMVLIGAPPKGGYYYE